MVSRRTLCTGLSAFAVAGTLGGCRYGAGSSADDTPTNVQIVVDTGPGGGSDVFARQLIKIGMQNKLIDENWPVLSKPQGEGLGAMAYLRSNSSKGNVIAAFSSKWAVAGMAADNPPATLDDLTPIVELAEEQQMIAVPAQSPYQNFTDFIADAKRKPGKLTQVGGAHTSVDNLVALKYQQEANTSWKYLSFDDGGPRITALLRGDAQMMIGAQSDFSEQVSAGKLRIIGVMGTHRATAYPKVPTLTEQGLSEQGLPQQLQFRGIAGPPGMPQSAIDHFTSIFTKLVKTPQWAAYMKSEANDTRFATQGPLKKQIASFSATMRPLVAKL